MQNMYTYHIKVQGQMDAKAFNVKSPFHITVVSDNPSSTLFTVQADQSGLIGLIRHLHGQGFMLLSLYRERSSSPTKGKVP